MLTATIANNTVHHRTSATIGAFKATCQRRGTTAIIVQITSSDAETEMWAKLLVAIIVLKTVPQTGAIGIITARMSRTAAIIGILRSRQCDHRVCNMRLTTTVMQSS